MKKIYKAPVSESVCLVTERMLALSVDKDTTVNPEGSFSNGKSGWDSSNWSADDEE